MPQVRAPGVYFEPSDQRVPALELGQTGVPVFVGMTRRGPLDVPVRVTNQDRFHEIFGERVPGGYLSAAVCGFFDNGGEICFVLRVARCEGGDDEDVARKASIDIVDGAGALTLRAEALDEGSWGNQLRITVRESADAGRTFITRDAAGREDTIQVKSTHGLGAGTLVRIHDADHEQWALVAKVDGKTVTLRTPLERAFASAAPTYVAPRYFTLRVREYDREERFEMLSLDGASTRFAERTINEQSQLIRVRSLRPGTPPSEAPPAELDNAPLSGGADGTGDLGPGDFVGFDNGPGRRRGLMGLVEYPECDLVAVPDLMAAYRQSTRFRTLRDIDVVQDAAISLCERSSNRFALLDIPPDMNFEDALRWRQQFDTAHGAFYYPWVVALEGGKRRTVPPSGHVAGIYSASDRRHGVHKAPANVVVDGIVDLEVLLQDTHLAMLNSVGINCLRPFGARGLRVWGARTASSNPQWRYLNVRRAMSSITAAIERGTQWSVFEANNHWLWKRLSRQIVGFLATLREQGLLAGATPEEAFYVRCNEETNPPESIDRGLLVMEIGLSITRPVEFIIFRLAQRLEDQAQQKEE